METGFCLIFIVIFGLIAIITELIGFIPFWKDSSLHVVFLLFLILTFLVSVIFCLMALCGLCTEIIKFLNIFLGLLLFIGFVCGCVGTGKPDKKLHDPNWYITAAIALVFTFLNIILYFCSACC